jgi:hypothetical protein
LIILIIPGEEYELYHLGYIGVNGKLILRKIEC